jgi:hypothetical protein
MGRADGREWTCLHAELRDHEDEVPKARARIAAVPA